MNYYEHHIGDHDAEAAHLTWAEDMAYTRLLRLYYRLEKPVPADVEKAARLVRAGSKTERQAVAAVLAEFFTLTDDGWRHVRADEQLQRYWRKCEHNREVGKLGGRPKKTETQPKPNGLSLGSIREPKPNPLQTPDTSNQSPDTSLQTQPPKPRRQKPSPGVAEATPAAPTSAVWASYSGAYANRYGVEPVRNASVNGQLAQFVGKLGADEAPGVAAFYCSHQNGLYVSAMHPTNLMLRDAEKLRTEWATGRQVTRLNGVQADRTQTNLNVFGPMIAEARAREIEDEAKRSAA